jgi:flagellar assembly protein FliH
MDDSVMRGIAIDGAPLRLRRGLPVGALPAEPAPVHGAERSHEEALRRGYEEGLALGQIEGRRAGNEEGLRSGREQAAMDAKKWAESAVLAGTATLVEERRRLRDVHEACQALAGELSANAEEEMVALCYETICRVVGELSVRPEVVSAMLAQVLANARGQARVLLRVHPQDAVLLDACGVTSQPGQAVSWRADPSVTIGGCVLEAPGGGLDLRLDTMLENCKAALLRAREQRLGEVRAPGDAS